MLKEWFSLKALHSRSHISSQVPVPGDKRQRGSERTGSKGLEEFSVPITRWPHPPTEKLQLPDLGVSLDRPALGTRTCNQRKHMGGNSRLNYPLPSPTLKEETKVESLLSGLLEDSVFLFSLTDPSPEPRQPEGPSTSPILDLRLLTQQSPRSLGELLFSGPMTINLTHSVFLRSI